MESNLSFLSFSFYILSHSDFFVVFLSFTIICFMSCWQLGVEMVFPSHTQFLLILSSWWSESHSVLSDSLQPHGLYSPWTSPGQNTGVGSLSLLQGIFPTQGSIPGLPHCRWILYQLSYKGSLIILEWVAYPFSRGSSQRRNWTQVSCIAGRIFTKWPIRGANYMISLFISWTLY